MSDIQLIFYALGDNVLLILMFCILRLLSLSSGHTELQLDTWQKLKAMEVERRARLNEVPSPNQ